MENGPSSRPSMADTVKAVQAMVGLVRNDPELYAKALDIVNGDAKLIIFVFIGLGTWTASISAVTNKTESHATDLYMATLMQLVIYPALSATKIDPETYSRKIESLLVTINQRTRAGDA